jgi:hypothetical protein
MDHAQYSWSRGYFTWTMNFEAVRTENHRCLTHGPCEIFMNHGFFAWSMNISHGPCTAIPCGQSAPADRRSLLHGPYEIFMDHGHLTWSMHRGPWVQADDRRHCRYPLSMLWSMQNSHGPYLRACSVSALDGPCRHTWCMTWSLILIHEVSEMDRANALSPDQMFM